MEGTLVVDESPWSDPARCRGESAALRDFTSIWSLYFIQLPVPPKCSDHFMVFCWVNSKIQLHVLSFLDTDNTGRRKPSSGKATICASYIVNNIADDGSRNRGTRASADQVLNHFSRTYKWGRLNKRMLPYEHRDSHYDDEKVLKPSDIYNGISIHRKVFFMLKRSPVIKSGASKSTNNSYEIYLQLKSYKISFTHHCHVSWLIRLTVWTMHSNNSVTVTSFAKCQKQSLRERNCVHTRFCVSWTDYLNHHGLLVLTNPAYARAPVY